MSTSRLGPPGAGFSLEGGRAEAPSVLDGAGALPGVDGLCGLGVGAGAFGFFERP